MWGVVSLALYEIKDIWFRYPDGTEAVKGVSFRVYAGDSLCLVGKNGAGKSTILYLLAKLFRPLRGEIMYKDRRLKEYPDPLFRREVGIVFQDPTDQFFNPTALDEVAYSLIQIGYGKEEALEKSRKILREFELDYAESKIPHRLSFGEKKILALLSIIIYEPETLLLDEPFANVDFFRVKNILSLIKSLREKSKTLIISTQSTEYLRYVCERVILLNNGVILADETMENIKPEQFIRAGLKPINCNETQKLLEKHLE